MSVIRVYSFVRTFVLKAHPLHVSNGTEKKHARFVPFCSSISRYQNLRVMDFAWASETFADAPWSFEHRLHIDYLLIVIHTSFHIAPICVSRSKWSKWISIVSIHELSCFNVASCILLCYEMFWVFFGFHDQVQWREMIIADPIRFKSWSFCAALTVEACSALQTGDMSLFAMSDVSDLLFLLKETTLCRFN